MWEVTSAIICGIITTLEVIIFGKVALEEEIQISKKKFIIISLGISLIFGIISLLFYNISKTLIIIILDIIFYKYVFKITMKKSTFLTFLYIVILLAADLIELFFVTKILHVSMAYCYNAYAGSVLGNITILILFTIITYIFKRLLRKIINNKITNNTKIVFFAILTIICTLMFFYTIIKEFRFNNNVLIYLIAIVVLLTVLFSLIKQTITHLLIYSTATFPVAYFLYWMPHNVISILIYYSVFITIYFFIWLISYTKTKITIKKINTKL